MLAFNWQKTVAPARKMMSETEPGNPPVHPGQTFGDFIVLSVGTGVPVMICGRVVATGSVLYNFQMGKTTVVREDMPDMMQPKVAPVPKGFAFGFFRIRKPTETAKVIKRWRFPFQRA